MSLLFINTVSSQKRLVLRAPAESGTHTIKRTWDEEGSEARLALEALQTMADDPLWPPRRIVCVTGPGRFTSTRVGVVIANALSYALQIPLSGMDRLECAARLLRGKNEDIPLAIAIAGEYEEYYLAAFPGHSYQHEIAVHSADQALPGGTTTLDRKQWDALWKTHGEGFLTTTLSMPESLNWTKSPLPPLYAHPATVTVKKKL